MSAQTKLENTKSYQLFIFDKEKFCHKNELSNPFIEFTGGTEYRETFDFSPRFKNF